MKKLMCRKILHMSLVFSFKPGASAMMLDLNHVKHGNYSLMEILSYNINYTRPEEKSKGGKQRKMWKNCEDECRHIMFTRICPLLRAFLRAGKC